jgi:hypothetical protein
LEVARTHEQNALWSVPVLRLSDNRTPVLSGNPITDQDSLLTTKVRANANVLPIFLALQCLDFATTLQFLARGVSEGNPLLTAVSLPYPHAPWVGLIAAKLTASLIGFYCCRSGRIRVLRLANAGYFLIIAWNLTTIAAATLAH